MVGDFVGALFYYSNMLSNQVSGAVDQIDAALDVLSGLDLSGLSATDLVGVAERCETLVRRHRVVCGDVAVALSRRETAELGGAPHKVLADWLRITPAEARRRVSLAEPLAPRTSLTRRAAAAAPAGDRRGVAGRGPRRRARPGDRPLPRRTAAGGQRR